MKHSGNDKGYLFSRRYSNYVFVLLFLLYMFDYIDRTVVTSMFSSIEADLGISHTQSGMLVSAVYWAIVLLTFPVSIIVDRWSRTKTIAIMAVVWSLATALCALTGNFIQLFLARMLIGVGEAGYAPGGSAMISGLYPIEKRSKMMGLWNASIPLGTAIGVFLGGIIATHLGWKYAFGLVAFPGLIVAILFFFVKDYKTVDLSFFDKRNNKVKMERKDIFREFLSRYSIIYTYFGITASIFVTTSLLTWLPTYFQISRDLAQDKAGSMASSIMALALVGAPLGGIVADKWRRTNINARLLLPALSTLVSAVLLFLGLFLFRGIVQYITFLVMGVTIMMFISGAASVTQDVIHPGLRATSYSIAVVVQNLLGASMAPIVIGFIYDHSDIKTALSILPFVLVLSSLLFYLGSKYYARDIENVTKVQLEVQ
ncbi:MAG TPA: MFS transporter [Bacteroidales bacterium]|jgi:MFS family permease|nr:MFS transporter [Bacteroidales bacterium]MDI9553638.1 MFS transporter [Bacteroidota bacterium]MBP7037882.1 MFS transporter [Bacteroidales bacterium]MZP65649.1 MFS transporter [Bacteroidales bacterium]NLK53570.1 MFS transporter [Bacteroidales bacterium]